MIIRITVDLPSRPANAGDFQDKPVEKLSTMLTTDIVLENRTVLKNIKPTGTHLYLLRYLEVSDDNQGGFYWWNATYAGSYDENRYIQAAPNGIALTVGCWEKIFG